MFAIGFDPGYAKLGLGILNLNTNRGFLWKVDLTTWGGTKHKLTEADFGPLVYDLVRILRPYLKNTVVVNIEQQPPAISKSSTTSSNTIRRYVFAVQCHLESAIRGFNPAINIYLTDPKKSRKFWNTCGKNYSQRKFNSINTEMLNPVDLAKAKRIFKIKSKDDGKVTNVDAIEAMQLCVYATENMDKLEIPTIFSEPRGFKIQKMECQVNKPSVLVVTKVKTKRKRKE